ncbi:acyl transferase/acyl hydrolase/lysophospholipase [Lineolata rhizophorae]|uniref:Acyl transferase/acyl hydrolase/lysophospholipase n=1 Tax=Lineolata rhizophorae TaxID=578093 RepID=A0A6A6NME7_9PEZI|nr:acyl transferase/acyl hydrolase/lysophospholipase [Lineolata rhizophorae]
MDGQRYAMHANGPLVLLALDCGGIRGVCELVILDEIMRQVQSGLGLGDLPKPCDYFHLIGGTGTGGLIALLLGRFQMDTQEALRVYNDLAGAIFSKGNQKWKFQDGAFKATTVEAKVKELVASRDTGEFMMDSATTPEMGKAFVCAMPATNMAHPRRFRTYPARNLASANCSIWEAVRATSVAPTFFKRIAIGEEGRAKEEFVDGSTGCSNPSQEVLEEARNIFGEKRGFCCLVSVGAGHPGTIEQSKPDAFQKMLPRNVVDSLRKITTSCQDAALRLNWRFRRQNNLYFRFNVSQCAGSISLEEWKKTNEIESQTKSYMEETEVTDAIDRLVKLLCAPVESGHFIGDVCQS